MITNIVIFSKNTDSFSWTDSLLFYFEDTK